MEPQSDAFEPPSDNLEVAVPLRAAYHELWAE